MSEREKMYDQLIAVAVYLKQRRDSILKMWRRGATRPSTLEYFGGLDSLVLHHIPSVLNAFERDLAACKQSDIWVAREQHKEVTAEHELNCCHYVYMGKK